MTTTTEKSPAYLAGRQAAEAWIEAGGNPMIFFAMVVNEFSAGEEDHDEDERRALMAKHGLGSPADHADRDWRFGFDEAMGAAQDEISEVAVSKWKIQRMEMTRRIGPKVIERLRAERAAAAKASEPGEAASDTFEDDYDVGVADMLAWTATATWEELAILHQIVTRRRGYGPDAPAGLGAEVPARIIDLAPRTGPGHWFYGAGTALGLVIDAVWAKERAE